MRTVDCCGEMRKNCYRHPIRDASRTEVREVNAALFDDPDLVMVFSVDDKNVLRVVARL